MNTTQKKHLIEYLDTGVRYDGRGKEDLRDITITYGVSKTAEGSAEVSIGKTKVIAGVKMTVEKPYPDRPDEGGLMVNAEFLPLASAKFEIGQPPIEAIELARVVDRGIREAKAIDSKKLCIKEGEKVWNVSVDVCTINDNGNLLDVSAIAALAAIKDAKLPTYDEKTGIVDYKTKTKKSIPLRKDPIAVTVYKIGAHLLVDPLPEEEEASDARLTITLTADGNACSLQKGGDTPLTVDEIDSMVELAIKKAKEIRKKF